MSLHIAWIAELDIDKLYLVLYILDIFRLENLILEHKVFASLLKDLLNKSIQVIIIQLSAENILVNFLAKLHYFFQVLVGDVVLCWVALGHHEHLVVLLPEGLEVGILLDDQIDYVQGRKDFSEVVEDFVVDDLFERVLVNFVLIIE